MWKLAWDFFLSLTFRAVFAFALVGGVSFLEWTYRSWRTGFWQDEPHFAQLSFLLAGVATLVGLIGTFRRGRAEARFSMVSLMAIAIEAMGSVCLPKTGLYLPETHVGERTLRRFPSVESFLLGGLLIILWLVAPFWQEETWILRNAAIIGGAQIIWGFGLECLGVEGGGAGVDGGADGEPGGTGPDS